MSIFGSDFLDFIEDILDKVSLNNDIGHVLFAVAVMGILSIVLSIFKANGLFILLLNLILFVLFASIGYFPNWTLIFIALLILILIFTFIGGGKND